MNGQQLQYVCLNCGVPFTGKSLATERDGVIECKRCGYWNTMPRADQAEEVTLQLSHARHELTCARFDTAFSAYQKASDLAEKLKKQELKFLKLLRLSLELH